jgi:hypothetical protein
MIELRRRFFVVLVFIGLLMFGYVRYGIST